MTTSLIFLPYKKEDILKLEDTRTAMFEGLGDRIIIQVYVYFPWSCSIHLVIRSRSQGEKVIIVRVKLASLFAHNIEYNCVGVWGHGNTIQYMVVFQDTVLGVCHRLCAVTVRPVSKNLLMSFPFRSLITLSVNSCSMAKTWNKPNIENVV